MLAAGSLPSLMVRIRRHETYPLFGSPRIDGSRGSAQLEADHRSGRVFLGKSFQFPYVFGSPFCAGIADVFGFHGGLLATPTCFASRAQFVAVC